MTNLVTINENQAVTTSKLVAKAFEKHHYHVVRDIESLECSQEFKATNFGLILNYSDLGHGRKREDKAYNITRDGFTFLAMGYTGKRAAEFKEAYIKAFNEMEAQLKAPAAVETKYSIEDLIIAQATSMKEIRQEIEALKAKQLAEPTYTLPTIKVPALLEVSEGTQKELFPAEKLVSIKDYLIGKSFTKGQHAYIGALATEYSKKTKLHFEKFVAGNKYFPRAIEHALSLASKSNVPANNAPVIKNTAAVDKIIAQLNKNPYAQELKVLNIGESKSYRGNLKYILKNVIYQKIHKCSNYRFAMIASRGWVKIKRTA
jgi:Rha family phage regulatory protein